jgi:NDP-sugar pyrophosphorylase family protein
MVFLQEICMKLDIIFLCGGYGKRMGELASKNQKCMLRYQDKPILQYGLEAATKAFGSYRPILAVSHLAEDVKKYFGTHWNNDEINYIHHPGESEDRGVLAGVRRFLSGGLFLVIHGDIIFDGYLLESMLEIQEKVRSLATLCFAKKVTESHHALAQLKNNEVIDFRIPEPQEYLSLKSNGLDIATYGEDITPFIEAGYLRDMYINAYDSTIYNLIDRYPQEEIRYLAWMLGDQISKGGHVSAVEYAKDWLHFERPEDLRREISRSTYGELSNQRGSHV